MSIETKTQIEEIFKSFPFRGIIALLVIALSFGYLFMLLFYEIPEGNRAIINVIGGILFGLDATIIAYYFGSSKDSSDASKANAVSQIINGYDTVK